MSQRVRKFWVREQKKDGNHWFRGLRPRTGEIF